MMTDSEIIKLYFDRNEKAITATMQAYDPSLKRLAYSMICPADGDECVGDTYLAAWNQIPPTVPKKLKIWLMKVLRNIICDRIDWNNASKRGGDTVSLTDELAECLPDPNSTFSGLDKELGEVLSSFLKQQTSMRRILFLRRYWYGFSIKELAKESGLSESAVKTTLHRMRNDLKAYLQKEGISV